MNSMFTKDYKFRDIYLIASAAEDEEYVPERAISGLQGWIDCYDKSSLKGTLFCGGVTMPNDISGNGKLSEAYEMGRTV